MTHDEPGPSRIVNGSQQTIQSHAVTKQNLSTTQICTGPVNGMGSLSNNPGTSRLDPHQGLPRRQPPSVTNHIEPDPEHDGLSHMPRPSQIGSQSSLENDRAIKPYRIDKISSRTFAKSAAVSSTYKVKFNDEVRGRKLSNIQTELHQMFDDVLQEAKRNITGKDLVVAIVEHDDLNHGVVAPLQEASLVDASSIMSRVQEILQSDEKLSVNDSFGVTIGTIRMPKGGHKRKYTGANSSKKEKKRLLTKIICVSRDP